MKSDKGNQYKLYLHLGGNCVYVVNDQLVTYNIDVSVHNCPFKSFNFLLDLYNHKLMRPIFPEVLHRYFESNIPAYSGITCLSGVQEFYGKGYCFDAVLDFIKEGDKSFVLLSELKLVKQRLIEQKIDEQVILTPREAFFTFGNICTNGRPHYFWFLPEINLATLKEDVINSGIFMDMKKIHSEGNLNSEYFLLDYVEYIKEQIRSKRLLPEELFDLSGGFILSILADLPPVESFIKNMIMELVKNRQMPITQRIIYYSFLNIIPNVNLRPFVIEFLEEERSNIELIRTQYQKKF